MEPRQCHLFENFARASLLEFYAELCSKVLRPRWFCRKSASTWQQKKKKRKKMKKNTQTTQKQKKTKKKKTKTKKQDKEKMEKATERKKEKEEEEELPVAGGLVLAVLPMSWVPPRINFK